MLSAAATSACVRGEASLAEQIALARSRRRSTWSPRVGGRGAAFAADVELRTGLLALELNVPRCRLGLVITGAGAAPQRVRRARADPD
jgi:hypothetical protein